MPTTIPNQADAAPRQEVVTPHADMLRLFVKHERFRSETDVRVAETQKVLTCDCWKACLPEIINVFMLHNGEESERLSTRPA